MDKAEILYEKAHASDNLQPNMIAIGVCGVILPYVAVTLRFFLKRKSVASIGKDDWTILAALVCHGIANLLIFRSRKQRLTKVIELKACEPGPPYRLHYMWIHASTLRRRETSHICQECTVLHRGK